MHHCRCCVCARRSCGCGAGGCAAASLHRCLGAHLTHLCSARVRMWWVHAWLAAVIYWCGFWSTGCQRTGGAIAGWWEGAPEFVERMKAGMQVTFVSRVSEAVCAMRAVCVCTSHFFSNPAKVQGRGHSAYHWRERPNRTVSRVPDAPRGCRVDQSDGLVRLTILSADGQPKRTRGHALARSQQLPTAGLI